MLRKGFSETFGGTIMQVEVDKVGAVVDYGIVFWSVFRVLDGSEDV